MTQPEDTTSQKRVGSDPSNTEIDLLTAPLDPDDDIARRIEMCSVETPALLESAGAVGEEEIADAGQ